MSSRDDMAMLPEGDPMNVDGGVQGLGVMGAMEGMDNMSGMDGMDAMGGMGSMDGIGGMGGMADIPMSLDDVDLFGDPVMNNALAGLPPRPLPSKQLKQRLEELRTRGCCQGIAWSRQGTIASIAKDGASIDLRFIRCNPDTAEWELSEPSSWSPPPSSSSTPPAPSAPASLASSSAPFVHLAWAPTLNPDLAAIDALGRVALLSFNVIVNKPFPVRRWESDVIDDLHGVVGCYWLPMTFAPNKQYHLIHGPAVKNQSEYKYEHQVYPAAGPWHPQAGKSALLCVTTNGALKLFYMQPTNHLRLEETSIELESVTSCDELITHASLCSDKNTLLIALATASKQLRIVRATIQWGLPPPDKPVPAQAVPPRPSLRECHIDVTSWAQHDASEPATDASAAQLTHIEILPSAPAGQSQPMAPPVVLTVRSCVPENDSPYEQESQSIIDRWEIVGDQPQSLSSAFGQLGTKPSSTPAMPRLRKLDPIVLQKVVVTVTTTQFGRVLCFAFSDGTVQYRDRFTLEEIYGEQNTDSIMHPLQVGFKFGPSTPCLQVAFSPTNCSFVQVCEDSTVKWNRLHYPTDEPDAALQKVNQKAVLAGLTIPLAATAVNQVVCDDILALARPFTQLPDFASAWVRETVGVLKIAVDYSEDTHHDQLVRNTLLQFCWSMLGHLSFRGEFQPRSPDGKFATLALGLKNIFLVLTVALNSPPAGVKERFVPLDDPDVVDAMTGCTRWGLSLLAWIMDSLFELLDDGEVLAMVNDPKRFPELAKHLRSKKDVALQLMLCSSTRGFLAAACRRLVHVESVSTRAANYYENLALQQQQDPAAAANAARIQPALHQAYQRLARALSAPLVKVSDFDRLLSELGSDIQAAYQRSFTGLSAAKVKPQHANMTEQQQQQLNEQFVKKAMAHCELDIMLGRNPPPSFREVLAKFFTATLPAFRNLTDPAKLYFANYDLLELDDDNPRAMNARKVAGRYVDVFKRTEFVVGPRPGQKASAAAAAAAGAGAGSDSNAAAAATARPGAGGEETRGAGRHGGAGTNVLYGVWSAMGNDPGPLWRRCVRCAAVMEDASNTKPGYNFVLSQQRKCICGGNWVNVPRGT